MTYSLTREQYLATAEKIAKINERASRKGFTGTLTIECEVTVETTTNDLGFETTETVYNVAVGGEPPCYNGYTLLATLDWDANAGLIVRTAPGVESVKREGLREGWCDHCKTNRDRVKTYLVGTASGEQVQVGSTCIKDFLGWSGSISFLDTKAVTDELDFGSAGVWFDREYTIETVLAASWAAIQAYGYEPAASYGQSTKEVVFKILDPRSKWDRAEADKLAPFFAASYPQAKIVRDWVLSDEFKGDSEYVYNLKAITGAEYAGSRNIGFLASAPQAWARAQAKDLIRKAENAEIVNEWVGELKDKIEVDVKIKYINYSSGQYGTTTIYKLVSTTGNAFTWFSTNGALGETAGDGTVYTIKGTVKGFDEYQGLKSTTLTRCKLIKEVKAG